MKVFGRQKLHWYPFWAEAFEGMEKVLWAPNFSLWDNIQQFCPNLFFFSLLSPVTVTIDKKNLLYTSQNVFFFFVHDLYNTDLLHTVILLIGLICKIICSVLTSDSCLKMLSYLSVSVEISVFSHNLFITFINHLFHNLFP